MSDEMLRQYSAALDEVYRLRTLLAVEGSILAAHLTYKTFPKSRRGIAEEQVDRMYRAARGESRDVLAEHPDRRRRQGRGDAGMPETLTRAAWESTSDGTPAAAPSPAVDRG